MSNRLHECVKAIVVPEKLYECAGDCNRVHSANMMAHSHGKNAWYCAFCLDDAFFAMDDDEREREFDEDPPLPPSLPAPYYCCPNDFCREEQSFPPEELYLFREDGQFWCSDCYPDESGESEHALSLQQYLAQEASHGIKLSA